MRSLALLLALLAACNTREVAATGGRITQKECVYGRTSDGPSATCRLTITYMGCLDTGECAISSAHLRPAAYNRLNVGDWYGENPARIVPSENARESQETARTAKRVFAIGGLSVLSCGIVWLVYRLGSRPLARHLALVSWLRRLRRQRAADGDRPSSGPFR